jgi:DNA-binding CsgD family transcriptional regulator
VRAALSGYSLPLIRRFARASALSRREIEAVILVAQGLKPKEIADRMNCSEPTIYSHLSNICDKTGCSHYLGIVAKLFAFACHALGHTPPDLRALADGAEASEGHRPEDCSS